MAEIRINATGGVKLYDADDSHYAQIVAGTITSNVNAITLGHDVVSIVDNLALTSDSAVLKFGADNDTTLTHTDGTGLTLNSTNKLCFNDATQFIQGSSGTVLSIGATDEIDLTATAVDLNGTLNVSGVATFQATPVFPDGSLALADLDIDGATDIGAAIVDADLFIVDDGAGGTNRKTTAARLKTYAGFSVGDITGATAVTVEPAIDDEFLFNDGGALKRIDFKHMAMAPGFMTFQSAAQTVANNSGTKAVFDEIRFNIGGTYDDSTNYRWTPGIAGWYLIWINAQCPGIDDNEVMGTAVLQNGTAVTQYGKGEWVAARADHMIDGQHQIIVYADADDYFEARYYQNSGDSQNFATYASFGGFRIAGVGDAGPSLGTPQN